MVPRDTKSSDFLDCTLMDGLLSLLPVADEAEAHGSGRVHGMCWWWGGTHHERFPGRRMGRDKRRQVRLGSRWAAGAGVPEGEKRGMSPPGRLLAVAVCFCSPTATAPAAFCKDSLS